jgi:hypothetical protein
MNSSVRNFSLLFLLVASGAESSVIDSDYRAQNLLSSSVSQQIYGRVLKSGYYTDCKMIPSDSRYVSSLSHKCGMTVSLVKGIGRFFNERDAGMLGFRTIVSFQKISYEDQAVDCSLFH